MAPLPQPGAERAAAPAPESAGWRRWLPAFGTVSASFTALCCLGVSAALSLSTAVGATFLTRDSTLRPILAATLALTVAGSALTYWRSRRVGPLVVTTLAAAWIYGLIFVVGGTAAGNGSGDHMGDKMVGDAASHPGHGLTGGRLVTVWVGLVVLIGAQIWDFVRTRRSHHCPPIDTSR